jgi:uncharacterized protein
MELNCVLPLNVLIIGASGNLGSTVVRYAVSANHNVSVFVRNQAKLESVLTSKTHKKLKNVFVGNCLDFHDLNTAIEGQDCVIECIGNNERPAIMVLLIQAIEKVKCPNFIALGGSPALLLEDGSPAGPALGMQSLAELHLNTLMLLRQSSIPNWTQVCPCRMSKSPDRKESSKFKIRPNVVDLEIYAQAVKLYYEDVALVMVNVIDVGGSGFHGNQIAFALIDPTVKEVEP